VKAKRDAGKEGRDAGGRFVPGNKVSSDRGWRTALSRIMGREPSDPGMRTIATDAARLNGAILRTLPSDDALVRTNVATLSMHAALVGYWSAIALDLGLSTEAGQAASERARIHGQRVERLTVTVHELASKLAKSDVPGRSTPALAAAVKRLAELRRAPEADEVEDEGEPAP
jgi:hypothetical protein